MINQLCESSDYRESPSCCLSIGRITRTVAYQGPKFLLLWLFASTSSQKSWEGQHYSIGQSLNKTLAFTWKWARNTLSILIFTNDLRQRTCSPEQWIRDKGPVVVMSLRTLLSLWKWRSQSFSFSVETEEYSVWGILSFKQTKAANWEKYNAQTQNLENNLLFLITSSVYEVDQILILFTG